MNELKRGDELRLETTDAVFGGKAIARYEGMVVFVQNAVPHDVVIAKLLKVKKNFAEAKTIRIEHPSPLRVEPHCSYFGVCGGCTWQHVDYQAQLRFKEEQVVDSFERIGGFSHLQVLPILGAEDIYFYRSKMEYSFAEKEWLTFLQPSSELPACRRDGETPSADTEQPITAISHGPVFLGLHVPQRYDKVLDIEECHLQSHISNRILNFTRLFSRDNNLAVYRSESESGYLRFLVIRESKKTKEVMVNLVTYTDEQKIAQRYTDLLLRECPEVTTVINTINSKKAQIAFGEIEKIYYGSGCIREQLGKHQYTISASSFFQTNVAQAEKLYEAARKLGGFKSSDVVFDLYSGTGSIAIFLSDAVKEVIGIESIKSAVCDAEKNAQMNGITNCRFLLGDIKDRLTKDTEWMSTCAKPDVILLDPPRSGMHPKVVDEIISLSAERIVYVSCNPATQARDVKALCAEKYQLVTLQPVDMFPHTYHIENIALLHRH